MNGYYRGRYECYATTATASFEAGRSLDDKWSAACDTGLTTPVLYMRARQTTLMPRPQPPPKPVS